jgi:hypothetical protein
LILIEENDLGFSSLKHELGLESSGQLQHHLQKLSDMITEKENGNYGLTETGRRALRIYRESESSGRSLEEICCIPAPSGVAANKQVSNGGTAVRLAIGSALLALTTAALALYFVKGQNLLSLKFDSSFVSLGAGGVIILAFFGISFAIAAATGYPGCEITAIPNLFFRKKMYCSCIMAPFNLPNGRLLKKVQRV